MALSSGATLANWVFSLDAFIADDMKRCCLHYIANGLASLTSQEFDMHVWGFLLITAAVYLR